jgi:dTDP-4-amino-4,6-dideoxygalactose transaminase
MNGRRDEMKKKLVKAGISTMVYYPIPVHELPIYSYLKFDLPQACKAASEVLSLPIWPQISRTVQERVADSLRGVLA